MATNVTAPHPFYNDPAKQAKLEVAIGLGLIRRFATPNPREARYVLTSLGKMQWDFEKQFNQTKG